MVALNDAFGKLPRQSSRSAQREEPMLKAASTPEKTEGCLKMTVANSAARSRELLSMTLGDEWLSIQRQPPVDKRETART